MESVTLSWQSVHKFGPLWYDHLKIRKRLFVDEMDWDLPHSAVTEWDQYDTDLTQYVITHEGGHVIAASRMLPCDHESGGWSYMIRDAYLGRIPGISDKVIQSPPTDSTVWEATRFTTDPTLSRSKKMIALAHNAHALAESAVHQGAQSLIALMPPFYIKWLTKQGLNTERLGPDCLDGTGNKICTMRMDLSNLSLVRA